MATFNIGPTVTLIEVWHNGVCHAHIEFNGSAKKLRKHLQSIEMAVPRIGRKPAVHLCQALLMCEQREAEALVSCFTDQ